MDGEVFLCVCILHHEAQGNTEKVKMFSYSFAKWIPQAWPIL